MKTASPHHPSSGALRFAAALFLCAAAGSGVQAQPASLAGPSNVQANKSVAFSGSRFAPNTAVTVMVKTPSGAEAGYSAVSDADGRLVYEFMPTESGVYSVRVLSTKGKELAASNVMARR